LSKVLYQTIEGLRIS
jgi:hypothetical protein